MPGLCKRMLKLRVSACDSEVRLAPNYALHVTSILLGRAEASPTLVLSIEIFSIIGASLSEPHIGENCTRNPYIIIIIFIMVRPSPARRSIYNVQRPHTSARRRQFLMLYSASKSCLRSSANFCALRAMLITANE